MRTFVLILILTAYIQSASLKAKYLEPYHVSDKVKVLKNTIEVEEEVIKGEAVLEYPTNSMITSVNSKFNKEFSKCTDTGLELKYCYIHFMHSHRKDQNKLGAFIRELINKPLDYPIYFKQTDIYLLKGSFFKERIATFKNMLEAGYLQYEPEFPQDKLNRFNFNDIYLVFLSNNVNLHYLDRFALVPLYDRIDFSSEGGNVEFTYSNDDSRAEIKTLKKLEKGEKLKLITKKPNSRLLLEDGFTLPDNKNTDSYEINVNGSTFTLESNINTINTIIERNSKDTNLMLTKAKDAFETVEAHILNYRFTFSEVEEQLNNTKDTHEQNILRILQEELYVLEQYKRVLKSVIELLEKAIDAMNEGKEIKDTEAKLDEIIKS